MVPYFLPGWCLGQRPLQSIATACQGIVLDLPGYGASPLQTSFSAAVDELAARLPPHTPLIGWSLGAQLAIAIAARYPSKVEKLVLISGTPSFVQRADWPDALPEAALAAFQTEIHEDFAGGLKRFINNFNRGDLQARRVTRTLLEGFALDTPPSPLTLQTGLQWLGSTDLRAELPEICAPTLLLQGAHDPLMPLAGAKRCAQRIPQATLVSLEGCAHAPFVSAPEVFFAHLMAFLHG